MEVKAKSYIHPLSSKLISKKMKKIFLLTILCCLSALYLYAQDSDKAQFEAFYRLNFLKDTTTDVATEDLMVLRMNKHKSIFYSYNSYTLDSLLCSDQGQAIRMDIIANGAGKYGKRVVSYNVLKDFKAGQIDHTDNVGGEHYRYQEPLPQFDWNITDEQKKIGDYACQKAVCHFRGRTYEAWFTEEIPLNEGPWKFHGLPGLILEVRDTQNHYSFTFVGLQNSQANITLLPRQYTRTSRVKYLKAYRNYIKDPIAFISASSGMKITLDNSSSGKSKAAKATKYDTMERD